MNELSYNKQLVFAAGCYGIFLFGISIITLGSTLPHFSRLFSLTEIDKGTLASIFPAGILLGSLMFGPIVDRYSYKYLLSFSVLLMALGFEVIAFSTEFFHLGIALFLIGWGGGMINGATSSLISDFSEDAGENKSANLSLMGVFFGLGSLGMPVLLGSLERWFTYDQILFGLGIAIFIPVILLLGIQYPAAKQVEGISVKNIGFLLRDSILLLMALILFFQGGMESMVNNWTTTFLIETKAIPEKTSLFYLTVFVITFTLGRFALGFMLNRFSAEIVLYISITLVIFGSLVMSLPGQNFWMIISLILFGFGLAAGFPVILGFIGDRFARWTGTAFGIAFTGALLGNSLVNYLVGVFSSLWGIRVLPFMLVLIGATALILIIITMKKNKNN